MNNETKEGLLKLNSVNQGDCLELMQNIADKSVDMILSDLPYGTTACKWDVIIPFEPLWEQYKRIIKDNGAIVLTASQPFTSALVMSNPKMFKYEWVWDKVRPSGFQIAKYRPMQQHENILVFCKNKLNYYPQKVSSKKRSSFCSSKSESSPLSKNDGLKREYTEYNPRSILIYSKPNPKDYIHPTQKPVALFEYLIKTYTNEGDLVLDNCAGSFTTAIACLNTKRSFIGIEKDAHYFQVGKKRIEESQIGLC